MLYQVIIYRDYRPRFLIKLRRRQWSFLQFDSIIIGMHKSYAMCYVANSCFGCFEWPMWCSRHFKHSSDTKAWLVFLMCMFFVYTSYMMQFLPSSFFHSYKFLNCLSASFYSIFFLFFIFCEHITHIFLSLPLSV